MALENLDDLEAQWAVFLEERNAQGKLTQAAAWRRDNKAEWDKLRYYRGELAPRPDLTTQMGRMMVESTDAWFEARESVPPPPPGTLGVDLPANLPDATGPVITVRNDSELRAATSRETCAPNTRINIPTTIAGSGDIYFAMAGQPGGTIQLEGDGALTGYSSIYFTGQYIKAKRGPTKRLEIHHVRAVRPTTTGRSIVLDGLHIHDNVSQGILTSSGVGIWQVRNTLIERNGVEANYDHNIYAAVAQLGCLLENVLSLDPWAYNFQLWPSCQDLIVTCCTLDGGQTQPDWRGGIVLGGEGGGAGSNNNKLVGVVGTRAPYNGVLRVYQPASGNEMFDSLGWDNSETDFPTNAGIRYENCISANESPYVNADGGDFRPRPGGPLVGLIKPARFGLTPPLDMNGNPRVVRANGGVDAGALVAA